MQTTIVRALVLFLVLAMFGVLWVNTGSHTEAGYTNCAGSGFFPASEFGSPVKRGDLCLNSPATRVVAGRYEATHALFLTVVLGILGGVGTFGLALLLRRRHHGARHSARR